MQICPQGLLTSGWNITQIFITLLATHLHVTPVDRFSRIVNQMTWTDAKVCLLGFFWHYFSFRASNKQESLANAKVNARQHCVAQSHWKSGNAIWRTTMFHVVASQTREITRNSERIRPYGSSRSLKVIDLGVNGKPIGDFLLVINSNFSRIWYRFRDIDA